MHLDKYNPQASTLLDAIMPTYDGNFHFRWIEPNTETCKIVNHSIHWDKTFVVTQDNVDGFFGKTKPCIGRTPKHKYSHANTGTHKHTHTHRMLQSLAMQEKCLLFYYLIRVH